MLVFMPITMQIGTPGHYVGGVLLILLRHTHPQAFTDFSIPATLFNFM